ncbi:MAG: GGDEF domain-containing protein [Actinobacteria bacterium]|nr:GGDEF domain-containing protein [Actinomycetota bacterium]
MGGIRRRRTEPEIRARRDVIVQEQVARETPWVMLALALLIIFFDTLSAVSGLIAPLGYYVSDVIQGVFFLVAAFLVGTRIVKAKWAPWVFAAAIVVNIAALSYQQAADPSGNAIGIILMTMVLLGGLLAMWLPFAISAVLIVSIVTYTMLVHEPATAAPWIIATLTGVGASAALLAARRSSATALAVATIEIEALALRDQATGLLNRHGLEMAAEQLTSLASRSDQPVFAVFVDVVGLKAVNDGFGHVVGDLVIVRSAQAVRAASRDADLVARWGGDEFLVIGIGPEPDALEYADRIAANMDLSELESAWHGRTSVGTAVGAHSELSTVISAADAAMYSSRRSGDNRIFANPVIDLA